MPRRHILTERQRRTLLALPTDEPSLLGPNGPNVHIWTS